MKLKQKSISSKKDSTLLRHLILLGTGKDSINIINSYIDDYLSLVKDKYDANNLAFLSAVTTSISSHGFRFFLDNVRKIDTVLGADAAEGKIYSLIESDILKPFTTQYPDWKRREAGVEPFGVLGQEVLRQYKLFYAVNHQDSTLLKEIFLDWFKNGGMQRKWINQSDRILNGIAWAVFDNLADKEALEAAKSMAEASIKLHYEPHVLDTYANILYKLGKTDEALKWEEKAIELAPKDDVILNTFEKMKAGQKTWDAPADSK
jgi:tetratricopeptide (TPR) repeat protein